MGVAAPGVTVGVVGGRSGLKRIIMVCTYLHQDMMTSCALDVCMYVCKGQ